MTKRIIKIAKQKTCSLSGGIQSKKGNCIIEKEKILKRWNKYIRNLYKIVKPTNKNMEKPAILKSKISLVLAKMVK